MASFVVFLVAIVAVCAQDKPEQPVEMCNMDTERNVTLHEDWISVEGKKDLDENGNVILLDGDKIIELKQCDKTSGPLVSQKMYDACVMQATCRLSDGSMYELLQDKEKKDVDCFSKLDPIRYPWGFGWVPLSLYSSVVARGLPMGTKLMVNQLIGKLLPNTDIKHNGCVKVDDTFVRPDEDEMCEIHLQVGFYEYFEKFDWPNKVTITVAQCEILKYD